MAFHVTRLDEQRWTDDQDLPGLRVATLVGALEGSVHLEIRLCELPASSAVPAHRHPFEESFHVLEGEAQFAVGDLAYELGPGDHGFIPAAVPHAWRNPSGARVRWLETRAPQPRRVGDRVGVYPAEGLVWPGLLGRPIETDPRHRWVGHFSDDDMAPYGPISMPGYHGRPTSATSRSGWRSTNSWEPSSTRCSWSSRQVDLERAPVTTSRLRTSKLRQRVGESESRLAASVGNDEGQQPRHNRKSSSADRSGRVRHRGQATPFRKPTA